MANRVKSAFVIDKKDSEPAAWEGGQMSRTRFAKTFTGALTGTSIVEAIMLGVDGDGPSVYVAIERLDCRLDGRAGTFLLLHSATMQGNDRVASWTIVTGSGTGELAGIRGDGEILANHEFVLTYDIGV